jgi:FtsX-like permease family
MPASRRSWHADHGNPRHDRSGSSRAPAALTIAGDAAPLARDVTPLSILAVDSGYFATLRIPIVRGRPFDATDRDASDRDASDRDASDRDASGPVGIVNPWAANRWCQVAIRLLLALVGVYGVLSYSVRRRTRELGIRRALGASLPNVYRLIVRDAVVFTTPGVLVGVIGALYVGRFVAPLLYGTPTCDPATFVVIVASCSSAPLARHSCRRRAPRASLRSRRFAPSEWGGFRSGGSFAAVPYSGTGMEVAYGTPKCATTNIG